MPSLEALGGSTLPAPSYAWGVILQCTAANIFVLTKKHLKASLRSHVLRTVLKRHTRRRTYRS